MCKHSPPQAPLQAVQGEGKGRGAVGEKVPASCAWQADTPVLQHSPVAWVTLQRLVAATV
jgi:hypothetical protein